MSKTLQCTLCETKFAESDIKGLKFFIDTMICSNCYDGAQEDKDVCFGKKKEYERKSVVCKKICPDRKVCRLYVRLG